MANNVSNKANIRIRRVIDRPLTHDELDDNFQELMNVIDDAVGVFMRVDNNYNSMMPILNNHGTRLDGVETQATNLETKTNQHDVDLTNTNTSIAENTNRIDALDIGVSTNTTDIGNIQGLIDSGQIGGDSTGVTEVVDIGNPSASFSGTGPQYKVFLSNTTGDVIQVSDDVSYCSAIFDSLNGKVIITSNYYDYFIVLDTNGGETQLLNVTGKVVFDYIAPYMQMAEYNNKAYYLHDSGEGMVYEVDASTMTVEVGFQELPSLAFNGFVYDSVSGYGYTIGSINAQNCVVRHDTTTYEQSFVKFEQLNDANAPEPTHYLDSQTLAIVNGVIYVFAIHDEPSIPHTVYKYDIASNTWLTKVSFDGVPNRPLDGIEDLMGVTIGTDVYLMGGYTTSERSEVYKYDTTSDTYTQLASMPSTKRYANPVTDGSKIWIIGGSSTAVYEYDIAGDSWITKTAVPFSDHKYGITVWHDNKVKFILGGTGSTANYYEWDPVVDTWSTASAITLPTYQRCYNNTGYFLLGDEIYIRGGYRRLADGSNVNYSSAFDSYNLTTGAFTENFPENHLGYMNYGVSAATVGDDIYFIGGGWNTDSNKWVIKINMVTKVKTKMADAPVTFQVGRAINVGSKIYVFGDSYNNYSAHAVFDTVSNTWTDLGSFGRDVYQPTLGVNGSDIYVIGGNYYGFSGTEFFGIDRLDTTDNSITEVLVVERDSAVHTAFGTNYPEGFIYFQDGNDIFFAYSEGTATSFFKYNTVDNEVVQEVDPLYSDARVEELHRAWYDYPMVKRDKENAYVISVCNPVTTTYGSNMIGGGIVYTNLTNYNHDVYDNVMFSNFKQDFDARQADYGDTFFGLSRTVMLNDGTKLVNVGGNKGELYYWDIQRGQEYEDDYAGIGSYSSAKEINDREYQKQEIYQGPSTEPERCFPSICVYNGPSTESQYLYYFGGATQSGPTSFAPVTDVTVYEFDGSKSEGDNLQTSSEYYGTGLPGRYGSALIKSGSYYYVCGGVLSDGSITNECFKLRSSGHTYSMGNLPEPLAFAAGFELDSKLYVYGGERADGSASDKVYKYNGSTWDDMGLSLPPCKMAMAIHCKSGGDYTSFSYDDDFVIIKAVSENPRTKDVYDITNDVSVSYFWFWEGSTGASPAAGSKVITPDVAFGDHADMPASLVEYDGTNWNTVKPIASITKSEMFSRVMNNELTLESIDSTYDFNLISKGQLVTILDEILRYRGVDQFIANSQYMSKYTKMTNDALVNLSAGVRAEYYYTLSQRYDTHYVRLDVDKSNHPSERITYEISISNPVVNHLFEHSFIKPMLVYIEVDSSTLVENEDTDTWGGDVFESSLIWVNGIKPTYQPGTTEVVSLAYVSETLDAYGQAPANKVIATYLGSA